MAPEIILNNKNFNNTIDIWSIGIIIYELLAGCYLFDIYKENQINGNHFKNYTLNKKSKITTDYAYTNSDYSYDKSYKLEYLSSFSIRHGEAVAIGIALDCVYSHLIGNISKEDLNRIIDLIQKLGFDIYHPALAENDKINLYKGLQEFQEHLGGQLTITLLLALGKGIEVHEIDFEMVKQSVDYLANLA